MFVKLNCSSMLPIELERVGSNQLGLILLPFFTNSAIIVAIICKNAAVGDPECIDRELLL